MTEPYNPLDRKNLGKSLTDAILKSAPCPIADLQTFTGAGIYAIYYAGPFPPYKAITDRNKDGKFGQPVYCGKAVPPGARTGFSDVSAPVGAVLFRRLQEHADSIRQATNLDVADFSCRYLVTDDIWIPLAESLLIQMFKPLWNAKCIAGFGNHDPGGNRPQKKSPWDVIHPGRQWVVQCKPNEKTSEQILAQVDEFLTSN